MQAGEPLEIQLPFQTHFGRLINYGVMAPFLEPLWLLYFFVRMKLVGGLFWT